MNLFELKRVVRWRWSMSRKARMQNERQWVMVLSTLFMMGVLLPIASVVPGARADDKQAAAAETETNHESENPPTRDPMVDQILTGMQAHFDALPPYTMHVEVQMMNPDKPIGLQHRSTYKYEHRVDYPKFDSILSSYNNITEGEAKYTQESRDIFTGDQFVSRQQSVGETGREKLVASFRAPRKGYYYLAFFHMWGGLLMGHLQGDQKPLINILRDSDALNLQHKTEEVEGYECYVLEAITKNHGYYKLWIDPVHDFMIRKAIGKKEPGDMYGSRPIPKDGSDRFNKTRQVQFEISNVKLEMVDGYVIPVEETMDMTTTMHPDGTEYRDRMVLSRSNVKFHPDFEKIGAFVMDGIPDGTHMINFDPDDSGLAYEWRGGKIVPIDKGRTVVGRLRLPGGDDIELTSMTRDSFRVTIQPKRESEGNNEDRKAMQNEYSTELKVAIDGSFRIDNVPTGPHLLDITKQEISVEERTPGSGYSLIANIPLVVAEREFTIPEIPSGTIPDPIDLGSIYLSLPRNVRIGDQAPLFEVKSVDGQPVNLSKYRGRYVLLDFWGVWCAPCLAQFPHLRTLFDTYSNDNRFVMIGMVQENDPQKLKTVLRENDLPWIQALDEEKYVGSVARDYGVYGLPQNFLIGPDGTVISTNLHGEELESAVSKALK